MKPVWDAKDYHRSSCEQQRWALELLSKLSLNGHERVLDIGCGDGKVTAQLAGGLTHGSVLGIDSSESMIRFAQTHFPSRDFPNLDFEVKDARHLDFSREFDVMFSSATLHWIVDHLPVLRGIQRGLKASGRILLQMGGRGNACEILAVLERLLKRERWCPYFEDFEFPYGFYAPDEYKRWLAETGLQVRRLELIAKDMVHKGKDALAAWIRTTWLPYTERVPDDLRRTFIEDIVREYVKEHSPDSQGLIHVQMVRLEVDAEKEQPAHFE